MNTWVDRMKVAEAASGGSEFRSPLGSRPPPPAPVTTLHVPVIPGLSSDFRTQDFMPSLLNPAAPAVRQAGGIHFIKPFVGVFLLCRFFKALGKQNCWRLIGT